MLRAAGVSPPATDVVVRAWVRDGADPEKLAADSWLDLLLPRVLSSPEIFATLDRGWVAALVRLAESGRTERATLIRIALREMHDGGLRPAVALHRLLDPTPAEGAAHIPDYLALLSGPHAAAADLAQRALRRLDESGLLDAGVVAKAGRAVFGRTEKKIVRAQLAWLAQAVTRHPEEAGVLLAAVAAVAHGLLADREPDRLAAVDALVHLARSDGLDASLLGRELALLAGDRRALLTRCAESLTRAGRSGAVQVVRAVAQAAASTLLRHGHPAAGLLAVAGAAAAPVGSHGPGAGRAGSISRSE